MSGSNVIYFTTTDASGFYPTALWVSDGTAGGTRLIQTFPAGSTILPLEGAFGGFVFTVNGGGNTSIYITLGTPESTRQVFSGPLASIPANVLTNNVAYLSPTQLVGAVTVNNDVVVGEFSLSDSGLNPVATITAQSVLSPETVSNFTALSGEGFFVDSNAHGVARLYRTDGSAANTTSLFSAESLGNLVTETNASAGTRLFLSEGTSSVAASSHAELLAMTSTTTTPTLIEDFGAGTAVVSIINAANTLFVVVKNADSSYSVYSSDGSNTLPALIGNVGTTAPTQILVDGAGGIYCEIGNQVLRVTNSGTTVLGTFTAVGTMFVNGSTLYFGANDGTHGMQLWSSSGTAAGTTQIADINPSGDANPSNFAMLGSELLFSANDGVHGNELWSWNGTSASLAADIAPGSLGSNPASLTPATIVSTTGTALGLVTYSLSNSLATGNFGVSDGTLGGTSTGYVSPPGVISFHAGYNVSAPSVSVSHGSTDTTINVPIAGGTIESLSTTSAGVFVLSVQSYTATSTETPTMSFIGEYATTAVTLGTYAPTVTSGFTDLGDRVAFGATEYYLVERADYNDANPQTQLWSSDGTAANTVLVANLGSFADPGSTEFSPTRSSNAIATATGWAGLLANNGTGAVSLFTATGTVGNFTQITLGTIGLAGTIDNAGYFSLAQAGTKYFFSVANGATIGAVATGGTAATTTVLTTEMPSSSAQSYGDFTTAGSLVYFDDGPGGALFVSDGTASGTHKLMASGAYLAPYGGGTSAVATPATASVTQGGTTYFYFTAMQGGQIGLYYSANGGAPQQVTVSESGSPQALAQNAYITVSGGNIWFAAPGGTGYTTLWTTAPGASTATPVIDPNLFPSGSLLAGIYGAPEGVSAIQPGTADPYAPDTVFLTPGNDTVAGGQGDTAIYAAPGNLNAGDLIDGGAGINNLYLTGNGTFDLSAPTTLNNITQVWASGTGDHIQLRAGTTIAVNLSTSYGNGNNDVVIGAANADSILGSGNDTITVGSNNETISYVGRAIITAATAGAFIAAKTVEVAGGGSVTLGNNIDSPTLVTLDAPTNLTVQFSSYYPTIQGSAGADTITLANSSSFSTAYTYVGGGGGADTIIIAPGGGNYADIRDTAADLNGIIVQGFDFNPVASSFGYGNADFVDVTDFTYSPTEAALYTAGTLTITNAAGTAHTSLAIPGAPAGGGFVLASDGGSGTVASYIPQIFTLTTGPDTVLGTATNQISAPLATLSPGDTIDGGVRSAYSTTFTSTLLLQGAGNFDLALPAVLTGLTAIAGDTTGGFIGGSTAVNQTITLRNNLNTGVTLGAGHDVVYGAINSAVISSLPENFGASGTTIFVGDARETVQLSGQGEDVIHVTAATGLASVSDNLQGSYTVTGTEEVDGGGFVPIGGPGSIRTLELAAPTDMVEYGTMPNLVVGSTGTDTIDVTNTGAGGYGGLVTVEPNGGRDTVVMPSNNAMLLLGTQAQLNNTTIDGFNFLPTQSVGFAGLTTATTIDISDLAYSAGVVTTTFTGGTLSVLNGASLVDTFVLPLPGAGSFTARPDAAGTGTDLSFTATGTLTPQTLTLAAGPTAFIGSPSNDMLTIPTGALGAGQTLDGQGGDNVLVLSGSGSFDLTQPAVLQNFTMLQLGSNETVMLRPGLPLQLSLFDGGSNTLIGANAPDVIDAAGNNVVVGNPGATVIGGATITVTAATIAATIYGEATYGGSTTLDVSGGGGFSMGSNIHDVEAVSLTQTGAQFYANDLPGLALTISGTSTAPGTLPDVVVAGAGGDTITDTSLGGNILAGGSGDDRFVFQPYISPSFTYEFPAGDVVYGFDVSGNDVIDVMTTPETVVYSGGTLHVTGYLPNEDINIGLNGTYNGTFSTAPDTVNGGTDITFQGTITGATVAPCFAEGAHILTTSGEVRVEALRVGARVPTLLGQRAARVVWLGHCRLDVRRHPRPPDVQPVRVRAGAFGPGLPHRDLVLSPDHALFVGGVLIPVRMLVNGTSIVRLDVDAVTYWHVELDRHDVLLAEGLPAESFLDAGNRKAFENAATTALIPQIGPTDALREAYACAPLVVSGPMLQLALQMLTATAAKPAARKIPSRPVSRRLPRR